MIAALLFICGQSVELPATIRAQPGTFVLVKPTRLEGGSSVRYFSPDPGLSTFPNELLNDKTCSVVVANRPGSYRVFAVTAKDSVISPVAQTLILVGDAPDPGPAPGPGPGPAPNPGPGPAPVPSDITKDPLFSAFQGIAGGLQEAGQQANFRKMAAAWAQAPASLEAAKTLGEATSAIRRDQAAQGLPPGALVAIRERVWGEVSDTIGVEPSMPLDATAKQKLVSLAARLAAIFKKLGE